MNISENIMISSNGFVFDASSGNSFMCNPLGIDIIESLKSGKTEKETKEDLLKEYEVKDYELDRDVDDFISMLRRFNLLA
jgi:hypothetical protein